MRADKRVEKLKAHIELIEAILSSNPISIEGNDLTGLQRAFTELERELNALIYWVEISDIFGIGGI